MPKLDNPEHEKWFDEVGKALAVAEKEDSNAEGQYRTLAKNLMPQFKRAIPLDGTKELAKQVKEADMLAQNGEFKGAMAKLEGASDLAMAVINKAATYTGADGGTQAKKGVAPSDGKKPMVPKSKGKSYEGEDKEYGWRKDAWNAPIDRHSDRVTTRYETSEEERKASAKDVDKDGRLVAHRDRDEKGAPKDGKGERPMPDGKQGYVIDPKTGTMHTFDQAAIEYYFADGHVERVDRSDVNRINALIKQHGKLLKQKTPHHTTPLAGGDVGGAGEITTEDGHLREISDLSGHYKPGEEQTHQTVKHLDGQGALTDERTPREALEKRRESLKSYIERLKSEGKQGKELKEAKRDLEEIEERIDNLEEEVAADAPMHREAKVKLIGKIGLSDEEYANAAGDKKKMYQLIAEKAKKELMLDLDQNQEKKDEVKRLINEHFKNHPVMNMLIGKEFELELAKSQYLQTEGNERQARGKQQVNKEVRDLGRDKAQERKEQNNARFEEEVKKLGGEAKIKELGFDPQYLKPQEMFELLSGARPASHFQKKHDERKEREESRREFFASGESDSDVITDEEINLVPEFEEESEEKPRKKEEEELPLDPEEMRKLFDELGGDESVYDQICMSKGFVTWAKPVIQDKVPLKDKLAFLRGKLDVYEIWDLVAKYS